MRCTRVRIGPEFTSAFVVTPMQNILSVSEVSGICLWRNRQFIISELECELTFVTNTKKQRTYVQLLTEFQVAKPVD